jgi:phosphoglycerate kinase
MEKEIAAFQKLLQDPHRPFCAMIGGAKISTKCNMIEALLNKADVVLIGGGMTYTFMKAQGQAIGDSIHEDSLLGKAKELLDKYVASGKLVLPVDLVVADRLDAQAKYHVVKCSEGIPQGYQGADIGPDTVELFAGYLQKARTVFWNGPFGVFEVPLFATGTNAIAHILGQVGAETFVGGGDSIAAVHAAGVSEKMAHLSTGGGAALELVEFGTLPGIEVLRVPVK